MSENQQPNVNSQEGNQNTQSRGYISNDIADFSYLIGLVMDYYYAKEPSEDGEAWKGNTREEMVDEEIDKSVKLAFLAKLKKHQ